MKYRALYCRYDGVVYHDKWCFAPSQKMYSGWRLYS